MGVLICSLPPPWGTLAEPAKNEPCETACRMAEGVKRSEKAQNVHPLWEDRNL